MWPYAGIAASLWLVASTVAVAGQVEVRTEAWVTVTNPTDESEARVVFRFDLPEELRGKTIEAAYVDLDAMAESEAGAVVKLEARRLSRPWNLTEVSWQGLWPEAEDMGPEDGACLLAPGTFGTARFELTGAVQAWVDDPASNRGLAVSAQRSEATLAVTRSRQITGATIGPLLRVWYSE
jgi:hypothetical protein